MTLLRIAALGMLVCTSACFGYSKGPPSRPDPIYRKIEDAEILKMEVHLFEQIGLCPGLEGKLYANANVQWKGKSPVARNIGLAEDSLHPNDFEVTGPLVKGDANAHLFPDPDIMKSIETGFDATVVYKPNPTKFTYKLNFPPEYGCYGGWFNDGPAGGGGGYGGDGGNEGPGTNGSNGGQGGDGNKGVDGGRITGFVTVVATKFWPRLFAVILTQPANVFFLAPADRDLVFGAAGGQGGSGGNGGQGGQGGDQQTETREVQEKDGKHTYTFGIGPAGNGGNGGSGGRGGQGGKGGVVDITVDSAYPELTRFVRADVRGGEPGWGGAPGGPGGGGGSSADQGKGRKEGQQGQRSGGEGGMGQRGGDGSGNVRPGVVASRFQSIKGIALFGSPQARTMATAPPQGATLAGAPPPAATPPPAPTPAPTPPPQPTGRAPAPPPTNNRPPIRPPPR